MCECCLLYKSLFIVGLNQDIQDALIGVTQVDGGENAGNIVFLKVNDLILAVEKVNIF